MVCECTVESLYVCYRVLLLFKPWGFMVLQCSARDSFSSGEKKKGSLPHRVMYTEKKTYETVVRVYIQSEILCIYAREILEFFFLSKIRYVSDTRDNSFESITKKKKFSTLHFFNGMRWGWIPTIRKRHWFILFFLSSPSEKVLLTEFFFSSSFYSRSALRVGEIIFYMTMRR